MPHAGQLDLDSNGSYVLASKKYKCRVEAMTDALKGHGLRSPFVVVCLSSSASSGAHFGQKDGKV